MSKSSTTSSSAPEEEIGGEILPSVARAAIIERLNGKPPKPAPPEPVGYLAEERGVFITLYDKHGEIRAFTGTTVPECANIVEETRQSACKAAFEDPNFKPVKDRRELNTLRIEVCVLEKPEKVDSIIDLDPEIYGVILTATKRGVSGFMMPHVKGLNTVDKQLAAIRRQAGLRPDERLKIERFRAEKFIEPNK
ncbi:MAG: AMMECR1 domain-containing protein [Verrucomicrobiae bacterium]|nr:AMMECR1 domain-containing protein [Verrucomicrobiae bacterium]